MNNLEKDINKYGYFLIENILSKKECEKYNRLRINNKTLSDFIGKKSINI